MVVPPDQRDRPTDANGWLAYWRLNDEIAGVAFPAFEPLRIGRAPRRSDYRR